MRCAASVFDARLLLVRGLEQDCASGIVGCGAVDTQRAAGCGIKVHYEQCSMLILNVCQTKLQAAVLACVHGAFEDAAVV